jgi:hypothetical protein
MLTTSPGLATEGLPELALLYPPRSAHATIDGVSYQIAATRPQREAAFHLVYSAYTQRGLMQPNESRLRVTPFHLLPLTDVFVAEYQGSVIYTMTLVSDDRLGLPLESVYAAEVDERRAAGRHLAEVSCLAAARGVFSHGRMFDVFVRLVGLMFQSARAHGIDELLIAVHPRHARFYSRMLGFEQFGELRSYNSVCGNPAVGLAHNFTALELTRYPLYDAVYEHRYRPYELAHQPMPPEEQERFRPAAEAADASSLVAA